MFAGRPFLHLVQALLALTLILILPTPGLSQPSDIGAEPSRLLRPQPGGDRGLMSVIIQLEDDALAVYRGHLPGLPATDREVLSGVRLNRHSPASQMYRAYLAQQHRAFENALLGAIPAAQILHRFQTSFHGVSAVIPPNLVDMVRRLPGVKNVYPDALRQLLTEQSPAFIGADTMWQFPAGRGNGGEGIIVGVFDTGIWPEHASFADPDPAGKPYAAPLRWDGFCEAPHDSSAPLPCNNKLIGARQFLTTYKLIVGLTAGEFDSPRDSDGHGTHTASTAAGNAGVQSAIFGMPRGPVSGVAPRAHVAVYRVCGQQGCFVSDTVAAVEQAIADGVDVINFSISGGDDPYEDPVELSFLGAYAAGIFVAAAAGNNGPAPDSVSHLGGWVTTVAAGTTARHFLSDITLVASDGASLPLIGASVTTGIAVPAPVVRAADLGDGLCEQPFAAGTFQGVIVVCERGVVARTVKSFNVAAGSAAGMLLYNPTLQGLATDNHFIPSVHLEQDAGAGLLSFLASRTGVMATFTPGLADEVQGDVLAAFSARGGVGQTSGISKPDVTAPGVQILAGHTPQPHAVGGGLPGELFQTMQGTSMASPHVAGAAALIKALRPDWTPGQVKSALMTTANTTEVFKEDGVTPSDPFDAGSGRIDLTRVGDQGLTFHALAEDYLTHRDALWLVNYPSLYIPALSGAIAVPRTVRNEWSGPALWRLEVLAPADLVVTVPKFLFLLPGGHKTFTIRVDATAVPPGEVRHATLRFNRRGTQLTFPITIVRQQTPVSYRDDERSVTAAP